MRTNKPLNKEAYNLTYRLKKKYSELGKNRGERIFYCPCSIVGSGILEDAMMKRLNEKYGFQIQQTIM
jgi:hypothetical protein